MSANSLFPNITSPRAIFVRSLHIVLVLFRKCSVTFLLQSNMAKRRQLFFSTVGPETAEANELTKNQIRLDLKISKGDQGARI